MNAFLDSEDGPTTKEDLLREKLVAARKEIDRLQHSQNDLERLEAQKAALLATLAERDAEIEDLKTQHRDLVALLRK